MLILMYYQFFQFNNEYEYEVFQLRDPSRHVKDVYYKAS